MWRAASSFCTVTVSAACAVTTSAFSRCNTTAAAASTRGPPPTQPLRNQRGLHCGQRAVALAARLSQSSRQVSQPPPDPATPGSLPGPQHVLLQLGHLTSKADSTDATTSPWPSNHKEVGGG